LADGAFEYNALAGVEKHLRAAAGLFCVKRIIGAFKDQPNIGRGGRWPISTVKHIES
jgi:hypothetical protein